MSGHHPAKVTLISNALSGPPDEGTRKLAKTLASYWEAWGHRAVDITDDDGWLARKLLLKRGLSASSRGDGSVAVYVPTQSLTSGTLCRLATLRARGMRTVLIAPQARRGHPWDRALARVIPPRLVLSPSAAVVDHAKAIGHRAEFLPLGVDLEAFVPLEDGEKTAVRKRFGLSEEGFLLHVGHASPWRNLGWLVDAKERLDIQVVLVTGRSQGVDASLLDDLSARGIKVISDFVPDIGTLYAAAKCYVFPVKSKVGAIGVPLSVLEAMACNVPVVATSFDGLPLMFDAGPGLEYANERDEWLLAVERMSSLPGAGVENRRLVEDHSWEAVARRVLQRALSA